MQGEEGIASSSSLAQAGGSAETCLSDPAEWDELGFDPGLFNIQQTVFCGKMNNKRNGYILNGNPWSFKPELLWHP